MREFALVTKLRLFFLSVFCITGIINTPRLWNVFIEYTIDVIEQLKLEYNFFNLTFLT